MHIVIYKCSVDFYTVFYTSDCVLTLLSVFSNVLLITLSLMAADYNSIAQLINMITLL